MGSCFSTSSKISNAYIIDVQHLLTEYQDMSFQMLLQLDALNGMVYNKYYPFDYRTCSQEFLTITNKMEKILSDFQVKNRYILSTLTKKPEQFWIDHTRFCKDKCKKMLELIEKQEDLNKRIIYFEEKKHTYNDSNKEKHIELFNRLSYHLYGEIDYFNRSMFLPDIEYNNINPRLSEMIKYSKEPKPIAENPMIR
jgi:predicted nucleic acid-binding Zn ribbon protein